MPRGGDFPCFADRATRYLPISRRKEIRRIPERGPPTIAAPHQIDLILFVPAVDGSS